MKRLFIAFQFFPDEAFQTEVSKMKNFFYRDLVSWSSFDKMHLTLKFIGSVSEKNIPQIIEAMKSAFKDVEPSCVEWNKLGLFGSSYQPRVLWLGTKDDTFVKMLFAKLKIKLENEGIEYDSQNFVPHVTLARLKKIVDKKLLSKVVENTLLPIQKTNVDKIFLMESIMNGCCVKYENLFSVQLKEK